MREPPVDYWASASPGSRAWFRIADASRYRARETERAPALREPVPAALQEREQAEVTQVMEPARRQQEPEAQPMAEAAPVQAMPACAG